MLKNFTFIVVRRFEAFLVCLILSAVFILSFTAHAQENAKTVRVDRYESPLNQMDEFGRRSGYAYEYRQKIGAYSGWNYEYVEGSWPKLLQMLIDSEIDLMIDVSNIGECRRIHAARFVCIRLKDGTEKVVENTVPKVNGIGCKKLA